MLSSSFLQEIFMEYLLHGWTHLRWAVGDLSPQISLSHRGAGAVWGRRWGKEYTLPAKYNPNKNPQKKKLKGAQHGDRKFNCVTEHSTSYKVKADTFQFPVAVSGSATVSSTCFGEDFLIGWREVGLWFFIFWAFLFLIFPFRVFLLLRSRPLLGFLLLLWLPRLGFFMLCFPFLSNFLNLLI